VPNRTLGVPQRGPADPGRAGAGHRARTRHGHELGDRSLSATGGAGAGAAAATIDRAARRLALVGLFAGPLAFAALLALPVPADLDRAGWQVAAVAAFMAVWWFSQAVPLGVTALLPIVLFPTLGVTGIGEATGPYAHPLVFLFLGGFVVALTMERWNLHRRLAMAVIGVAGRQPDRLIGGFMLATAGLSMWVSNTATTLMMVPIAFSVIDYLTGSGDAAGDPDEADRFARGLLISVAYAASIGGLATLIGTPPNAFLAAYVSEVYGVQIGFGRWMLLGLPVSAVLLAVTWWLLTRFLFRARDLGLDRAHRELARARERLGPMGRGERMTAVLFAGVGLLWVFRPFVARVVPIDDTGIAIAAAVAAFVLPVDLREREFLMDWEHAKKLPWEILLLFGGGLSLAHAIQTSGLASWLGDLLAGAGGAPPFAIVLLSVALVVFLTELTSNTATAAVFVPIAGTLAVGIGLDPLILAVPVALAASCAFMMPVATPPNAIVFGAGRLTVLQMCYAGFLLNVIGTLVLTAAALYLMPVVFGVG
jgi:sodium-dependent dicarboxylate transporter 2/3/5